MSNGKNERNTIWIYGVVLFTSAFIVLLLTAYSQIKFNRNLSDYKSQLSSQESEKNNFKMSLNTALNENKKMNEELKAVKQELEDAKIQIEEGRSALKRQQQRSISSISAYDLLIEAQSEHKKGNILECAEILYSKIDSKLLESTGIRLYEELVDDVYIKASELLYNQGYKQYIRKDYNTAIKSFTKSLDYSTTEYFSDDCLYFIAYSKFWQGEYKDAEDFMKKLISDYPNSNYKKAAEDLIKEMTLK